MNKNEVIECNECGCAVTNKTKHKQWHNKVVISTTRNNHVEVTEDSMPSSLFVGMGTDASASAT